MDQSLQWQENVLNRFIDLHNDVHYLEVPTHDKSYLFGDNKSVVNVASTPHAKLHKCHTALSFHHVCKAVAAKIIGFYFIEGENNSADNLSKHWGYQQVWKLLHPILFWKGNMFSSRFDEETEPTSS